MLYLLYKIGLFILRVSTKGTAYRIVSFFAKMHCVLSKKDREIVKANLRVVFPEKSEKEISILAEEVFKNFAKYLIDFFWLTKNEKDYLRNSFKFSGLENINEALKRGKGCIIMAGHFGNWELMGCALGKLGYKINAIALDHKDPRINNLFINARTNAGMKIVHIGTANTVSRKALERGEIVGILGDRLYGDRGIEVEFFGKKAIFPRGAALFSLKNGSPIIKTFVYREDSGDGVLYRAVFEKPFLLKGGGSVDKKLKEITQDFIKSFEAHIKKRPSEWYMFNKIWD